MNICQTSLPLLAPNLSVLIPLICSWLGPPISRISGVSLPLCLLYLAGPTTNGINYPLLNATIILFIVTSLVTSYRCFSRYTKKLWWHDDSVALFSTLFFIFFLTGAYIFQFFLLRILGLTIHLGSVYLADGMELYPQHSGHFHVLTPGSESSVVLARGANYRLLSSHTGGKGSFTQWVHCEFVVSFEAIRPVITQQVCGEFF